jgi:hypothetical protein
MTPRLDLIPSIHTNCFEVSLCPPLVHGALWRALDSLCKNSRLQTVGIAHAAVYNDHRFVTGTADW